MSRSTSGQRETGRGSAHEEPALLAAVGSLDHLLLHLRPCPLPGRRGHIRRAARVRGVERCEVRLLDVKLKALTNIAVRITATSVVALVDLKARVLVRRQRARWHSLQQHRPPTGPCTGENRARTRTRTTCSSSRPRPPNPLPQQRRYRRASTSTARRQRRTAVSQSLPLARA